MEFDQGAHDDQVEAAYRRINRIAAFDKFVDLALDGVITMPQALQGFQEEYGEELQQPGQA